MAMARLLGSYVTCVSPLASPSCKLSPAAKARVRAAHPYRSCSTTREASARPWRIADFRSAHPCRPPASRRMRRRPNQAGHLFVVPDGGRVATKVAPSVVGNQSARPPTPFAPSERRTASAVVRASPQFVTADVAGATMRGKTWPAPPAPPSASRWPRGSQWGALRWPLQWSRRRLRSGRSRKCRPASGPRQTRFPRLVRGCRDGDGRIRGGPREACP